MALCGVSAAQTSDAYAAFVRESVPINAYKIFDLGIVDANQDGHLDLFSTNCQSKPSLLVADGANSYRDEMAQWGLQHSPSIPGFAMAPEPPALDKPGVYAYLLYRELHLRTHGMSTNDRIKGEVTVMSTSVVREQRNATVQIEHETDALGDVQARMKFSLGADALIVLVPSIVAGPMTFEFPEDMPLDRIFFGADAEHPAGHLTAFDFFDPHAFAWSDMNADGALDVFVGCGALRDLDELAGSVSTLRDRLLVQKDGHLQPADQTIPKAGCAVRGAAWVDFDTDGDLDLFVTCARQQRSMLFRRTAADRFENVAEECGLGPGEEAYLWLDVDDDLDPDLLTTHSNAIWLYVNEDRGAQFRAVEVSRGSAPEKFTFSDFDRDGDPDVFAAAREPSSLLLINDGHGGFSVRATEQTGLPPRALTAQWVDHDNDGRDALYILPGGLYQPDASGRFTRMRLADDRLPEDHTAKGLASWFDADNDGDLDLLSAVRLRDEAWQVILHRNQLGGSQWLAVDLTGPVGNRQAIGARTTLTTDGTALTRWVGQSDGSLSSQGHYRLYFGLGSQKADALSVRWPDGTTQTIDIGGVNRRVQVSQETP